MGVLIETSVWEPSPSLPLFLFVSSFLSITLFSHLTKPAAAAATKSSSSSSSPFDHPPSRRLHLRFLLLYSLASVTEGIWSVYGEFEFASSPFSKDLTLTSLCVCYGSALLFGTALGMLSDLIAHKRVCLLFWILHLFVAIWKSITFGHSVWLASICLSLATSIFSFSYEAWVVVENEKQAHRPDALSDMFWLMSFFEAAASIGSQMLVNWMMVGSVDKKISWVSSSSTAAIVFSLVGIVLISRGWKETTQTTSTRDYKLSYMTLLSDKRIGLLGFAHTCLQFSIGVFWILWAPTLVADGREVHLGLIYPCLMGSRMLGSTVFPWVLSGSPSLRVEDFLVYIFVALGLALSIVAYDYQEIGFLVFLFCLFHAGVGLILPSLARLRTMHVPNELRGGMMGLSLAPANAAILFLLLQRGYYQSIENSTMMALAALGLFVAAGCMHLLKRQGKQPYQNWHKL